ncbi:aspartyl/glutamyl-tRNA amidotransferase subunit A [Candidatus Woesebacteria bacterium]|nr:aspartyl/glutamyl-tRNA amidotransferase subunit A [Candidatus Woesebacteria bacterium]
MSNTILTKTLIELTRLIKTKELSAHEVNAFFAERSRKYNQELNAYVTLVEGVKSDGLQIAIKDNFCTKGIRTTASSKVLENFIPPYESTVTQKLLDAGISPLGKTNMDAWAHGSSTETSDFGPSKNPFDTGRAPGGSSGGSAVTVAAGLSPAAIGSETAGSIRLPASWCGIVGLKPTYGRVSRYGVIAMGSSLDSPGPMTKTVDDAAYLLSIIAGTDPYDATTNSAQTEDYLAEAHKGHKLRIGIADIYFKGVEADIKRSIENAIKTLEKLGHSVYPVKLMDPKYAISDYTIIQRAEVSSNLGRYDGVRYGAGREKFGTEAKKRIMLGTYTLAHGYYDAYYKRAQKVRTLIIDDFKRVFNEVDVIIGPTTPITAIKIGEFEKYPFFGEVMDVLLEPSSMAGLPAISMPCGVDVNGLPIGMQIMGPHLTESRILDLAYQFEQETKSYEIVQKNILKYQ